MNNNEVETCLTEEQLQFAKDQATFWSSEISGKHLAVKHLKLSNDFAVMRKLAKLSAS